MSHKRRVYTSDLSDEPWERLKPLLKLAQTGPGRPIVLDMRAVVNAIFYVLRTGCQWQEMPKTYPNHNSVYYHYAKWRDNATWQAVNEALPPGRTPPPRPSSRTERRYRGQPECQDDRSGWRTRL